MKPEQLEAHKRMLSTLPVETHLVNDDGIPKRYRGQGYQHGKHSKKCKPVMLFGKRYPSLIQAAHSIGKSRQLVYQWLMKGKDVYYVE
jgi:hypothetical protein